MHKSFTTQPDLFVSTADLEHPILHALDDTDGNQFDLPGGIVIKTTALNHPGGSIGYRVEFAGKSICYISDIEHVPGKPDAAIIKLIQGSDSVIYDATYCDSEFERFIGFGHSTWQEDIRLCRLGDVGRYCIFHHLPSHDDTMMASIENRAQAMYENAIVAREGMQLAP